MEKVLQGSCFDSTSEVSERSRSDVDSEASADESERPLFSRGASISARVPSDVRSKLADLSSCLSSLGYNVSDVSALLDFKGYGSFLQAWDISSSSGRFINDLEVRFWCLLTIVLGADLLLPLIR